MPNTVKKHRVYRVETPEVCRIHKARGRRVNADYRVLTFEGNMRLEEFLCALCLETEYSIEPEEFVRE